MGKKELSKRNNWQERGGSKALKAENDFYIVFENHFKNTEYLLHKKPKHLKSLYNNVLLPEDVMAQIYNPRKE